MRDIQPLIMCGGAGTRLWPTSRESRPKQFATLLGSRSSFQETVLRVRGEGYAERAVIVTNYNHRHFVEQQLAEIDVEADILLEPARRDSGPAILAATLMIGRVDPETPSSSWLRTTSSRMRRLSESRRSQVFRRRGPAAS